MQLYLDSHLKRWLWFFIDWSLWWIFWLINPFFSQNLDKLSVNDFNLYFVPLIYLGNVDKIVNENLIFKMITGASASEFYLWAWQHWGVNRLILQSDFLPFIFLPSTDRLMLQQYDRTRWCWTEWRSIKRINGSIVFLWMWNRFS